MRTIEQLAHYMKEQDTETALTKTAIRRLVITGALPSIKVGAKYLVAVENLEDYLQSGMGAGDKQATESIQGIRRVG